MKLMDGNVQKNYHVLQKSLPDRIDRRLEAIGMTVGTTVSILHKKKCAAMVIKVRGTRFAIGSDISRHIEVEEVENRE